MTNVKLRSLLCVPMFFLSLPTDPARADDRDQVRAWASYYPLARGNEWKYRVVDSGKARARSVTWKVANSGVNDQGEFFALAPDALQADDELMNLQHSTDGLRSIPDNAYVLRFPLAEGQRWKDDDRDLQVLSEGKPCESGKFHFTHCLVVQTDDATLRTLTTYARGIGPVRYQYYRLKGGQAKERPMRTMTLLSYRVAAGAKLRGAPEE